MYNVLVCFFRSVRGGGGRSSPGPSLMPGVLAGPGSRARCTSCCVCWLVKALAPVLSGCKGDAMEALALHQSASEYTSKIHYYLFFVVFFFVFLVPHTLDHSSIFTPSPTKWLIKTISIRTSATAVQRNTISIDVFLLYIFF
eukprot:gene9572-6727_t